MSAILLDGKKFSAEIRSELKAEVLRLQEIGIVAGLAGVFVGEDPGSATYIGLKRKACAEIGIREMMLSLPDGTSEAGLFDAVSRLNGDPQVHGIFIQLPLPPYLTPFESKVLAAVSPEKDVDGFHAMNVGKAWLGEAAFVPAVAIAMREMLRRCGFDAKYKNVVIVNVDNLTGKPFASVMVQDVAGAKANVTLLHPETPDLGEYTRRADVLVVSVNRPQFITAAMVKNGVVVLDFGNNRTEDPFTNKRRTVGDVDFDTVKEKASFITPVPGGVGPMLVTMLLANTVKAAKMTANLT